jgi:hypothetical protein
VNVKRAGLAVALTALVPVLSACGGGGSDNAAQPLPKAPALTVPGESKTPTVDNSSTTDTTTDTTTTSTSTATTPAQTTTQANPSTPQGGAAAPQTGGATPGGGQTTTTPSSNSPAGKFEEFCKENPGAC